MWKLHPEGGEIGDGISPDNTILISPNPSNGIFTIQSTENMYEIEIENLLGEKIYNSISNNNKSEINLTKQPLGIYFIRVNSKKGITTRKIIIQ